MSDEAALLVDAVLDDALVMAVRFDEPVFADGLVLVAVLLVAVEVVVFLVLDFVLELVLGVMIVMFLFVVFFHLFVFDLMVRDARRFVVMMVVLVVA